MDEVVTNMAWGLLNAAGGVKLQVQPADVDRAREVLKRMGLEGRESLPARLLSEGQRRRIALARLLVCNTTVWLLDEVLTSLDKVAIGLIRSLIEEHLSNGGIAIVATHQELELSAVNMQRLELAT